MLIDESATLSFNQAVTSNVDVTMPRSDEQNNSEESLRREVEDLSMTLVKILNDPGLCTNPFMLKHMSTTFRIIRERTNEYCPLGNPMSREEHLNNLRNLQLQFPAYVIEPLNACALIEPSNSPKTSGPRATVWTTVKVGGLPGAISRESVSILHWRKREPESPWVCHRHEEVRGGGGQTDY